MSSFFGRFLGRENPPITEEKKEKLKEILAKELDLLFKENKDDISELKSMGHTEEYQNLDPVFVFLKYIAEDFESNKKWSNIKIWKGDNYEERKIIQLLQTRISKFLSQQKVSYQDTAALLNKIIEEHREKNIKSKGQPIEAKQIDSKKEENNIKKDVNSSPEFSDNLEEEKNKEKIEQKYSFEDIFLDENKYKKDWEEYDIVVENAKNHEKQIEHVKDIYEKMKPEDKERITNLINLIITNPDSTFVLENIRFSNPSYTVPENIIFKGTFSGGHPNKPMVILEGKYSGFAVNKELMIRSAITEFADKKKKYSIPNYTHEKLIVIRKKPDNTMFYINMATRFAPNYKHDGDTMISYYLLLNKDIEQKIIDMIGISGDKIKHPDDFIHIYRGLCNLRGVGFCANREILSFNTKSYYPGNPNLTTLIIPKDELVEATGIKKDIQMEFLNEGIPEYDKKIGKKRWF